jgi:HEAT repeat protein
MSAADELGKMKARAAVPALLSALNCIGASAISALGSIGDEQALKPILQFLSNKDADVRRAVVCAAVSLGKPSSQDVMGLLIEQAQPSNQEGRVEAIEIIGGLGKPIPSKYSPAISVTRPHESRGPQSRLLENYAILAV